MLRLIIRRLAFLPIALLLVHGLAYSYALVGRWFQVSQSPFFAEPPPFPALWTEYGQYLNGVLMGDFAKMPGGSSESVLAATQRSVQASLGLLGIAFGCALVLGLLLGLLAVRTQPPRIAPWLIPLSSVTLAMPSFYTGAVILTIAIYYLLFVAEKGSRLPFPLRGFGWDDHLLLPVFVLAFRPALQIAQIVATALTDEFRKHYIIASRSFGHTWERIRWRTALKNALPPIFLTISNAFRWVVVELIIVEWFFGWPGLGTLLANALERPQVASMAGTASLLPASYLYPPVIAAVLLCFAALFLFNDLVTAIFVRWADPRLAEG